MKGTAVAILGMHRSGTSLVARLANLLGVYLGPETELVRAAADNPRGFWEHRGFVKLNEEILTRAGGSWRRVPELPAGWQRQPEWRELGARAERLIASQFAERPLWGFKDPRTCLTLPFWQERIAQLRYVLCLRHPAAVARSLARRDGLSLEKGASLWLRHVELALRHTEGRERVIVCYEKLLENHRAELPELARLLGRSERAADDALLGAVDEFVDSELSHHTGDGAVTAGFADVERVYRALADGNFDVARAIDRARAALAPELARREREEADAWLRALEAVKTAIAQSVPRDAALILIDDGQWAFTEASLGRKHYPFVERDGRYFGPPASDAAAIEELERLRRQGARFVALGAPSYWWLAHYRGFGRYLREHSQRVLERPELSVFELA